VSKVPEQLGPSVERMLLHLGAPPMSVMEQIAELWPHIVGAELAERAVPGQVREGVLVVEVVDAATESLFKFSTTKIAAAFAEQLGDGVITQIKLRRSRRS